MLTIHDLHFRYGKRAPTVLDGIELTLRDGEIGVMLGKNGSGKTTLFKTILGIEKPVSGEIFFDGEDLLKMSRRERARRIAYVPQSIHFGALSVFDTVLMGRVSYFGYKAGKEDEEAVWHILRDMPEAARSRFAVKGCSCHSPEEAEEAESLGASYITAGHVFATDCKKGLPPRGLDFLEEVCHRVKIPVFAIGGISPGNIASVREAGAAGGCVMSGLMTCSSPSELLAAFEKEQ